MTKKNGYYMKKNPFGKHGDYITAPLISNLFGEMIAVWCVAFWEHIKKPKKIIIVELGGGDGSLCKNLIGAFKNFKEFYKCLEIKLLEKSAELKKIQKNTIKNNEVEWIKNIHELNSGPIIFLANEFFDSLPIKQIYKKKKLFFEKHVFFEKKKNKIKFSYKKAQKKLIKDIKKLNLINSGNIIEYPIMSIKYLKTIANKINKYNGSLLIFDYGYTERKNQDTLQCVGKHKYSNIFNRPGEEDITHHINYNLFLEVLKKNKLEIKRIVTQGEFLQRLGILERAEILSQKINFREKTNMYYRLKKLLHYKEMGSLFKVLNAQKKGIKFSLGFL